MVTALCLWRVVVKAWSLLHNCWLRGAAIHVASCQHRKRGWAKARQSGWCSVRRLLTTSTVSRAYMLLHHGMGKRNDAVCGHGERCSSGWYVSSSHTKPRCGAMTYCFMLAVMCTHQQLCWNAAAAHGAPCLCRRVPLKCKYGRLMLDSH
jgi:hypothetical protein